MAVCCKLETESHLYMDIDICTHVCVCLCLCVCVCIRQRFVHTSTRPYTDICITTQVLELLPPEEASGAGVLDFRKKKEARLLASGWLVCGEEGSGAAAQKQKQNQSEGHDAHACGHTGPAAAG